MKTLELKVADENSPELRIDVLDGDDKKDVITCKTVTAFEEPIVPRVQI